ncbi:hypothetical protein ID866_5675 [Astraeus odoratus]|nr:hypothetical protein ID866_5675 [Astraeus odoratus]
MDRLAAMRAQQQGSQYGARGGPYTRQDDRGGYEMAEVNSTTNLTGGADNMQAFYTEITAIQDSLKTFNTNVSRIDELHSRSLNNTDDAAQQRIEAQLQELVAETSTLSTDLKRRIQTLERQGGSGRDGQIRKQQPDATPEEVRAVVNDENGGQIFTQALMNSNRYGESRAAYREVQERHQDIKRIEQTIAELAQLFNDMSVLVEQQDETINTIQTTAGVVEKDTEVGLQHTEKAVVSARAARRKRWICFFLTLLILVIIGVVVAVVITNNSKNT